MIEAPFSGGFVRVNTVQAYGDYFGAIRLYGGGTTPLPPNDPDKSWVDTDPSAPVYDSPTSTTRTGTLNAGTNYVYCRVWGREITGGNGSFNHWWLKTDPDTGPASQYVSAFYLSRWGNDEAKDNSGAVLPDCARGGGSAPSSTYWVDTMANASVYGSPTSLTPTGTLYGATNYVYCKAAGREVRDSSGAFNHWWLKTDPDVGAAGQWVSAYYLSRWGNDQAKDNSGQDIPNC
jgi:hypothetical protein